MNVRCMTTVLLISTGFANCNALAQDREVSIRSGTEVSRMLVAEQRLRWVPGQIIVKFASSSPDDEHEKLTAMGYTEHLAVTGGGEYIYSMPDTRIKTLSSKEAEDHARVAAEQMSSEDNVQYAQLNYVMHIVRTPDDSRYPLQWHYRDNGTGDDEAPGGINLPRAWERTVGSPASVVAVIDTGILADHPDIVGSPNLLPGFDMITDTFTANDGDGRDADATDPGDGVAAGQCGPGSRAEPDSWHGTHVAGTIGVGHSDNARGVAGVNWASRVLPLRALGRCGGSIADINDAMRWAAGLRVPGLTNNPNPAKIINMSLGAGAPCSASPATQSAIDDVVAAGVAVVVAAGNEASNASNSFPASCDNVITVAASDFNGDLVTRYSNFGDVVDIMAPGGDLSADVDNDGNADGVLSMVEGGYAFFNGTSMAAPHVAGVAGLLVAQNTTLTPQEIENLIKSQALRHSNSQCPEPCGAGLLNADIEVGQANEPPVQLNIDPTDFELDEEESATLTVTVTRGGAAVDGETVAFRSNDADVATISPTAATTDADGRVQATVTGISGGNTTFAINVPGESQTAPVTVNNRIVPGLGLFAVVLLALIIGVVYLRRIGSRAAR